MSQSDRYEKQLNFNKILSWIHSLRYKETTKLLKKSYEHQNNKWDCTITGSSSLPKTIKILEIGCANAKLFEVFNNIFNIDYYAIEINKLFYNESLAEFGHLPNFHIIHGSGSDPECYKNLPEINVIISLETLEHMPKSEVVKLLEIVSNIPCALFSCSVPIEVGFSVLIKNLLSSMFGYHRKKQYSWKETFWATIYRLDKLPPHDGMHKGFDYRWLINEINKKMPSPKVKTLPFNFLPEFLSNSVFIIANTNLVGQASPEHANSKIIERH